MIFIILYKKNSLKAVSQILQITYNSFPLNTKQQANPSSNL